MEDFGPVENQFEKVGSDTEFVKPVNCDGVEGVYLETYADNFENPAHKFKRADGSVVVVNGCGSLNAQMERVEQGDLIRLEYKGTSVLTKGKFAGKEAHNVDVLRAK